MCMLINKETAQLLCKAVGHYLLMLKISIHCALVIPHLPSKAYIRMFMRAKLIIL